MQIRENNVLIVRAPIGTTQKKIDIVLGKYQERIEKGMALIEKRKHKYAAGEQFMFLGKSYPLEIIEGDSPQLWLKNDKFYLTKAGVPYGRKLFTSIYRQNTLEIAKKHCEYYAKQNHLKYNKIGVTLAETRWGSCSYKNNLNFSYRLAMAPLELIDYVIVHELSHILEKNHSKNFWKVVASIMPDAQKRREELKKNARLFRL